jgi:hypothetical protein
LRLNPKNVKAWYRAASACLALDKVNEALDACQSGLTYEPQNAALASLLTKAEARKARLEELDRTRLERDKRHQLEQETLRIALKARNIPTRNTDRPPEMPEAAVALDDPLDASSTLKFPLMFLYPMHSQTDFIQAFPETDSIGQHLNYILPLPWDDGSEYSPDTVECYMETIEGGLVKAGKKLPLLKLLSSGKVEVVDGLVRVMVVPEYNAKTWIEDFKKRRGK